jgi:hypothetical protein
MSQLLSIYGYQISGNYNQDKETEDVNYNTVSRTRRLVSELSLQQRDFNPTLVHEDFVVDRVVIVKVFL